MSQWAPTWENLLDGSKRRRKNVLTRIAPYRTLPERRRFWLLVDHVAACGRPPPDLGDVVNADIARAWKAVQRRIGARPQEMVTP